MAPTRFKLVRALIGGILVAGLMAAPADARRGGSFGSRGTRTYYAPRQTTLTPRQIGPVQRSMTQPTSADNPWRVQNNGTPAYAPPRPASRFGGFGGGLLGGLIAGGLLGSMMGHGGGWGMGYGGMGGGSLISLIQLVLLGGLVWFIFGLFQRRSQPSNEGDIYRNADPRIEAGQGSIGQQGWAPQTAQPMTEIAITASDKVEFEQLLSAVQDAFGREDYARLRELATPEIMSYLSEELSQNATHGRRNEVRATRLIEAEVSEAWRESSADYATIAMHYESIDIMRDRATGAIIEGDPNQPTETTELWTFVRPTSGAWKLSAIQA